MTERAIAEQWLHDLTHLPTAPGVEDAVIAWVTAWVGERDDLQLKPDSGGNLLITQSRGAERATLLAVAHMDHPAFVINSANGNRAEFEFRGGVTAPYFEDAEVAVVSRLDGPSGAVVSYDPETQTGQIEMADHAEARVGDIAIFRFRAGEPDRGRFQAPACDDLAGCAAALAALDRLRGEDDRGHFGVLLTRAEEVGLVGAIHAAKHGTIPDDARLISIEASRELPEARIGDGPIIRTGDRATVFDRELTNRISRAAADAELPHQRKLMSGGGCEATAFGAYGFQATGMCLALGNWHNRGNLDAVEAGEGEAVPMLEEISLDDFHGLIDLLVLAAAAVDEEDGLRQRLDDAYESSRGVLGQL
ncbi:MAG: M20/M25/M40 family metallo-hydrolase [Acidimicrobiia bacterium]